MNIGIVKIPIILIKNEINKYNKYPIKTKPVVIKKLINVNPSYNLDPVLVSGINNLPLPKINIKDYIIIYAYTGRIAEHEKDTIIRFARKYNKKIISIGYYHDFVDKVIVCNPFKALAYIKNCDYVITDTFHGSIFSIIFEKQFVSFIRESNKEKMQDLLEHLNLKNRCLEDVKLLEKKLLQEINYNNTNDIINQELIKTKNYLLKCLDR